MVKAIRKKCLSIVLTLAMVISMQPISAMAADAPTVTGVSSSTANGFYKAGDAISIQVMFSQAVTVTGTPQLLMETGTTDRAIDYASGSGTSDLTFTYTVQSGDISSDLDYVAINSLSLNGGAIIGGGVNASLVLPAPGSVGSISANKALVIDTTAPAAPSTPDMTAGSDSGASSTDNITNDTTPTFTGTAEANGTVKLYDTDGTTVLGSGTVDGSGNWSITSSIIAQGAHTITAKAADTAGNGSAASSGIWITIDTTVPAAPSTPDMTAGSDSGASSTDNITNDTTPTFTGTAEANGTVKLYDTDGTTVLGSGLADGGVWSITSSSLSVGTHIITAKVNDTAGNVSVASAGLAVTIDTTAPTVTSVSVPANGSYKAGDSLSFAVTFDKNVTVTGTPIIVLTIGTSTLYAGYVSGNGTTTLVFTYEVAPGDNDTDGIAVGALSLNGGTMIDTVGNNATLTLNSVSSTASVLVDAMAPYVSNITRQTPPVEATHNTSVVFRVTFNEVVTGVDSSDFTLVRTDTANGTIASVSATAGTTIDVTVNSVSGNGNLRLDLNASGTGIQDVIGNTISGGYTSDQTYTIDTINPTVTITSSAPAVTNTSPIPVTFTFSEPIQGFTIVDLLVVNGLPGNFTAFSETVFTVDITPNAQGTVTVYMAAGVAIDAAVNGNTTATLSLVYDTTAPVPGGSGTITVGTISSSSVNITWSAATDSMTTADNLQYKVVYSLSDNITSLIDAETNGTAFGSWTANLASSEITGLTANKAYYFNILVKDAEGNMSVYTPATATTEAVSSDTTAPVPGGSGTITVGTISSNSVNITWSAATDSMTTADNLQYKVVYSLNDNITSLIDAETNGTAFSSWTANLASSEITGLSANKAYYFNILVKDADGNMSVYTPAPATTEAVSSDNSNDSSDSGTSGSSTNTGSTELSAVVIVDGVSQTVGTSNTSTNTQGQTTTTVTVDTIKLQTVLNTEGSGATVIIPITGRTNIASGVLTGEMFKNMEDKNATLVIQTPSGTYTVPAGEINIDAVSEQFGKKVSLSDIKVVVSVAEPSASMTQVIENAAQDGSFTLVVPAVEYTITCSYGGGAVNVSSFKAYVERTIAIPEGVDPTKITTGVVVDPDGTVRHVPTRVVMIDGKYYAVINSLTNSAYAVIWNPVTFADMTSHWAKDAVNDMGSRMTVTGTGNGSYEPDTNMTRAEFAAIIVRALGLAQGGVESSFDDVTITDWFNGYVETAMAYNLISGYNVESYGPNDTITREQAIIIIFRAMQLTKFDISLMESEIGTLLAGYVDGVAVSDYAKASVATCLRAGIVNGTSADTISPKAFITRAEVAVMIQRLLQKSGLI